MKVFIMIAEESKGIPEPNKAPYCQIMNNNQINVVF